ncbi:hypothetical protein LWE61_00045 [Sphingobium sufflavum]|uniref:hypothetical protein n=1 Tax=Sphingobium sufflavum TaxID=1129547 RepID=UPI001F22BB2C|nr:hypothetical protein [Sphingobium sufflavum]MCE7794938.1 hypothetical protein [Sphingobium sufflavum]
MRIIPRPVSPRSALTDLKDFLVEPRAHKWPLLALSMALTGVIMWAFEHDSLSLKPGPQIIYVESWMADRKDSLILERQKADLALYEKALTKKQREYQNLADTFGVEWRKDAARNKAQREAVIAAVNKSLDERIAAAKKREAASGAPAANR